MLPVQLKQARVTDSHIGKSAVEEHAPVRNGNTSLLPKSCIGYEPLDVLRFEWLPLANQQPRPARSYDIEPALGNRLLGLQLAEVMLADVYNLVLGDPEHIG